MRFEDVQYQIAHYWAMSMIEKDARPYTGKGSWKTSKGYRKLIKVQEKVIAHVKQRYDICHKKERQMREDQMDYQYLLHKDKECEFPPMQPLNSFE